MVTMVASTLAHYSIALSLSWQQMCKSLMLVISVDVVLVTTSLQG